MKKIGCIAALSALIISNMQAQEEGPCAMKGPEEQIEMLQKQVIEPIEPIKPVEPAKPVELVKPAEPKEEGVPPVVAPPPMMPPMMMKPLLKPEEIELYKGILQAQKTAFESEVYKNSREQLATSLKGIVSTFIQEFSANLSPEGKSKVQEIAKIVNEIAIKMSDTFLKVATAEPVAQEQLLKQFQQEIAGLMLKLTFEMVPFTIVAEQKPGIEMRESAAFWAKLFRDITRDALNTLMPAVEPAIEPVVEVPEVIAEPAVEMLEPVAEPALEPAVEEPEAIAEPAVEMLEPVAELAIEPIVEAPKPTVEPAVEVEPVIEPAVEMSEVIAEPAVEMPEPAAVAE